MKTIITNYELRITTRRAGRGGVILKLALLLFSIFNFQLSTVFAQHYVGAKVGYGAGHARVWPKPDKSSLTWGKKTGGVVWRYFSPQPVFGGLSAELEYQDRVYKLYDGVVSDSTSYTVFGRTNSALTLPLIWHPHFYLARRHVRLYLSLGVTFTYNLGLGDETSVTRYVYDNVAKKHNVTSTSEPYTMQVARDVRWNYGWLSGLGVGVLAGRYEFFAEGRYYGGMSDLLRNKTKYQFNEMGTDRLEMDNIFITIGVTVRLGKGGILAPPRKRAASPSGTDDFRNIKLNM